MKKNLFLVIALLLTISLSVSAQRGNRQNCNNRRRNEQRVKMTPEERANLMAKELNLTEQQRAAVASLCEKQEAERKKQLETHRTEREAARQARQEQRKEMQAIRQKSVEEHHAELAKIIGEENVEKWKELCKERRNLNRKGRRNPKRYNR